MNSFKPEDNSVSETRCVASRILFVRVPNGCAGVGSGVAFGVYTVGKLRIFCACSLCDILKLTPARTHTYTHTHTNEHTHTNLDTLFAE